MKKQMSSWCLPILVAWVALLGSGCGTASKWHFTSDPPDARIYIYRQMIMTNIVSFGVAEAGTGRIIVQPASYRFQPASYLMGMKSGSSLSGPRFSDIVRTPMTWSGGQMYGVFALVSKNGYEDSNIAYFKGSGLLSKQDIHHHFTLHPRMSDPLRDMQQTIANAEEARHAIAHSFRRLSQIAGGEFSDPQLSDKGFTFMRWLQWVEEDMIVWRCVPFSVEYDKIININTTVDSTIRRGILTNVDIYLRDSKDRTVIAQDIKGNYLSVTYPHHPIRITFPYGEEIWAGNIIAALNVLATNYQED